METKHTPGPWTFDNHSPAIPMLGVYAPDNKGPWHHERSDEEKEANSRLCSAAPELLEALKDLLYYSDDVSSPLLYSNAIDAAKAAILKATGG